MTISGLHEIYEVDHTTRVTKFVIIPGNHLKENMVAKKVSFADTRYVMAFSCQKLTLQKVSDSWIPAFVSKMEERESPEITWNFIRQCNAS